MAEEPARRHAHLEAERGKLEARARTLLAGIKGWEPVDAKRPGWELEDLAETAEREGALALARAVELHTAALFYDPQLVEAHRGLAELYWGRARAMDARPRRRSTTRRSSQSTTSTARTRRRSAPPRRSRSGPIRPAPTSSRAASSSAIASSSRATTSTSG
jgi:hypothetical protein